MNGSGRKVVRAVISGQVQRVFFRSWTVDQAEICGLDGWVRNRRDGDVEALFAGPVDAVDRMLEACWRGPDRAKVTNVRVEPAEDPGPTGFQHAGML